ncbi:MAG TPA: metallophosphoesterase [Burkholderiales bacterium]|nr:metallophosphoesterase [Burkholderiales bacterium]
MKRLLNPFVVVMSAILAVGYGYLAWRLTAGTVARLALAAPFLMIWIVPVVYWVGDRENKGWVDESVHFLSYLCMGWLNFLIVLCAARDGLLLTSALLPAYPGIHAFLRDSGATWVFIGSVAALGAGALAALRGPHVRRVDVAIEGLDADLDGLRIVQISDLHVGPTIRAAYVRRVVRMANALVPDLVALTGDLVDGSVARLAPQVAPLAELIPAGRVFLVLGNHEYYSGAAPWISHFETLGLRVLLNEHAIIPVGGSRLVVGGVLDPAAQLSDPAQAPRPDLAVAPDAGRAFRLLLAHNPKLAPLAEKAGFDLQLSGHTHAGQFFPWTLAVHLLHAPHVAGLSRRGRMWVYVSAGTGTWGPPVRFGTEPELTLLRLLRSDANAAGMRPSIPA